jgi:hypothetical protein
VEHDIYTRSILSKDINAIGQINLNEAAPADNDGSDNRPYWTTNKVVSRLGKRNGAYKY